MLLGNFITRLGYRLKLDPNATSPDQIPFTQKFTNKINEAVKEIADSFDWEELKRTDEIQSVPNYTTGTVTATVGSRSVTGSGATWDNTMQGRYIQIFGDTMWYKIAYVDNTTPGAPVITTVQPIITATGSGLTYIIWKRFYYLNSDVAKIFDFYSWIRSGVLADVSERQIQDITSNISNTGSPEFFTIYGIDPYERTYNTGTVTISQNTNLLQGNGTAFMSNVTPGDIVTIGVSVFRVKRVETDTRCILLNYSPVAFNTAQIYTIQKDSPLGVSFYYNSDKTYQFPYSYYKNVFDMVNPSYDRPDFSERFDLAILDGATYMMLRDELKDPNWTNVKADYVGRVEDLKNQGNKSFPRSRSMSPLIPTRRGYNGGPCGNRY